MTPENYRAFVESLTGTLADDERVLGLVALGSMAEVDYFPDRWSDHDFFVIVRDGAQEHFRSDLSWLPYATDVAFAFRETAHGLRAVYRDGHLVEFAVFDVEELRLAKVNRYRVLLDRERIEERLAQVREATSRAGRAAIADEAAIFGQFLTNLLVGIARHSRGERLSGRQFVKGHALFHLLVLLRAHMPSEQRSVLDDLDPLRRIELAAPSLGHEIDEILDQDTPSAARGLLRIAIRELKDTLTNYPANAVAAVAERLAIAE